ILIAGDGFDGISYCLIILFVVVSGYVHELITSFHKPVIVFVVDALAGIIVQIVPVGCGDIGLDTVEVFRRDAGEWDRQISGIAIVCLVSFLTLAVQG
ncbi:MAG: hypothetical protein GX602_06115, partial [Dehalococcoidales bacterium]|nr:hypothetical protein [Dehalococcoidales bacterium]